MRPQTPDTLRSKQGPAVEEAQTPGAPADRKRKSDVARLALVVLFFAAAAYVLHLPEVRQFFNVQAMRGKIREMPWQGRLAFVGLGTLLTGCGIPRLWISAAAGAMFGAVLGSAIALLASMLGATINFFGARFVLRGPVRRRMPARMHLWYERFNRNGFRWLLYMRLFPLSNATLTNLLGGVSKMSYGSFFAATLLGYIPLTIVFALFGSSAAKHNYLQLAIGALIFLSVMLARALYEKKRPKDEGEDRA